VRGGAGEPAQDGLGGALNDWTAAVIADDVPELRSFVGGLCRDHDAVVAGPAPAQCR